MRIPLLFPLAIGLLLFSGCNPNTPSGPPEAVPTTKIDSASVAPPPARKVVTRTINGKGSTSDQKPVSLTLTMADTAITGKLTADATELQVTGMLDQQTGRCWLTDRAATGTWRGQLIIESFPADASASFTGTFIISDSGGQSVIKGDVTNL